MEQDAVTDTWVNANFPVRSVSFFDRHAAEYDRIVYQMGNSPFHIYMFDALRRYPGVIVLHDFFLSGIFRWMAETSGKQAQFSRSVFDSHGYMGLLKERDLGRDWAASNFPCNLPIIQAAAGVIVHSQFSLRRCRSMVWSRHLSALEENFSSPQLAVRRSAGRSRAPRAFQPMITLSARSD